MNRRGFLSIAIGALVAPADAVRGLVVRKNIVHYNLPPRPLTKMPFLFIGLRDRSLSKRAPGPCPTPVFLDGF